MKRKNQHQPDLFEQDELALAALSQRNSWQRWSKPCSRIAAAWQGESR